MSRHAINRVIACKAHATAPLGGSSKAQAYPVGSTTIRDAPRSAATRIGEFLATAPSIRVWPPIRTGEKMPGIAVLARMASIAGPFESTTAIPSMSLAIVCWRYGMKEWVGTDRNVVLHDRRHRGSPPTFPNRLNGRKGFTPAHNRKHGDDPMDFLHFIGIDVSKNWFDVALDANAAKARRFDNTAEGIALFCAAFADHLKDGFVVLEATGGYETALIAALVAESVALHRAAPWQACSFSRSLGKQAKTDGLDAKALARFAAERHASLRRFELPSQDQQCLNELMMRRVDLVAFQMAEKTRADHPRYARATPAVRQSLADSRAFLESQIKAVETQIEALIAASPELRARSDVMTSQIGVGERLSLIHI